MVQSVHDMWKWNIANKARYPDEDRPAAGDAALPVKISAAFKPKHVVKRDSKAEVEESTFPYEFTTL